MLPLIAFILFILAAVGIESLGPLGVLELGLAAVALSLLLGSWPINRKL